MTRLTHLVAFSFLFLAIAVLPVEAQGIDTSQWAEYRTSTGATLRHPPTWELRETANAMVFLLKNQNPQDEVIFAIARQTQVSAIDDPSVVDAVDQFMRQAQPGLRRTDRPTTGRSEVGQVMRLRYAGTLGDGRPGAATSFAVLIDGYSVGMTLIGTQAAVEQREPTVEAIFASIRRPQAQAPQQRQVAQGEENRGNAQVDRNLVGSWLSSTARRDRNGGGGSYVSSNTVFTLRADGTWTSKHTGAVAVEGGGGSADGIYESTDSGTWQADGQRLTFRYRDGHQYTGTYRVFSNGVEIVPDGGDTKILLEPA